METDLNFACFEEKKAIDRESDLVLSAPVLFHSLKVQMYSHDNQRQPYKVVQTKK